MVAEELQRLKQRENAVIKAENAPGGGSRFLMRFYKTAV